MIPNNTDKNNQYTPYQDIHTSSSAGEKASIVDYIVAISGCVYRTSLRYIKNIPHRVQNKYLRYRNEKSRLPKRKTRNKVYMLVGYTTKERVERRYDSIKTQHLIRKVLIALILMAAVFMVYKAIQPLQNTDELKQIVGVDDVKDLTQNDPFGSSEQSSTKAISP